MDKSGINRDDIWFECSICGARLTPDSKYYGEDDFIYCEECFNNQPEPDTKGD